MPETSYKVLVNTSTIVIGGGLQVAASFISKALEDDSTKNWRYAISRPVAKELVKFGINTDTSNFAVFERSPARFKAERKRLLQIEKSFQPDLVFTLFGPAYVRFRKPHFCGVADGWVTHSDSLAFKSLGSSLESLRMFGTIFWKGLWWKAADYWWVEAPVARDGLARRWHFDKNKIAVIPNTCGPQFDGWHSKAHFPADGDLNIACVAAYYPHKNLEIIPRVAERIKAEMPDLDFRFLLTLPPDLPATKAIFADARDRGVEKHLKNVGRTNVADLPKLYDQCSLGFLPTYLEIFSAMYAECMRMGIPLVTTRRRFASDICAGAAVYFSPDNDKEAAELIIRLATNEAEWKNRSQIATQEFNKLPNATEKFQLLLTNINSIASGSGILAN